MSTRLIEGFNEPASADSGAEESFVHTGCMNEATKPCVSNRVSCESIRKELLI